MGGPKHAPRSSANKKSGLQGLSTDPHTGEFEGRGVGVGGVRGFLFRGEIPDITWLVHGGCFFKTDSVLFRQVCSNSNNRYFVGKIWQW